MNDKVTLRTDWATASDRDYIIEGRRGRDYYRLADVWLRNDVEAARVLHSDPGRAAELRQAAVRAREEMGRFS